MAFSRQHELGLPPVGFENIQRYWDQRFQLPTAKILPGEYYVTEKNELIATLLGSCISACIRDTVIGIGGMNHFMLPLNRKGSGWCEHSLTSMSTRYGNYAMEHMINDILKIGGRRCNLEAKIFGGGRIISSMSDLGARNIEFVEGYLAIEGIPLVNKDVGDIHPRQVIYSPRSGKVRLKRLIRVANATIVQREEKYLTDLSHEEVSGEVELF